MPSTLVFSLITHHRVIFVFAYFFHFSLPFNYYCNCDLLWFRMCYLFKFSLYSYFTYILFNYKLISVIFKLMA